MTNVSVYNGMSADTGIDRLDLIQEFISEETSSRSLKLPGPPPPPPELDSDPRNSRQDHIGSGRNGPVLVSRGTAQPQPIRAFPQASPTAHLMKGSRESTQRPGRGGVAMPGARPMCQAGCSDTEPLERLLDKPELVVKEQPKERGMRFRYECEGRSAGSILGAGSNDTNKTLPTIELQGPINEIRDVKVTVSLVTKDIPYRPHPHCLVGKDCTDGICVIHINPHNNRRHSFCNLGIQCVRRKELDLSLKKRREQKIDPFNTGHSKSIEDMDMNVVRLCFQCELETEDGKKIHLSPIVSNPIFDKKATTTSELKITRLNVVKGPCTGKTEIFMLCDKVQKDDIEIIFSLGPWEAKAEFAQTDVHRQIAIVFKSPPYQDQELYEDVEVNVLLRRLSDRMDSEPVKFTYTPPNADPYWVTRKRKIKPDVKFPDQCNYREPAASAVGFDPFPFAMESSGGMAKTCHSPSSQTPAVADLHPYPVEDIRLDDHLNAMDPETMSMLFMEFLQDNQMPVYGTGHQEEPLDFPMPDQASGNMDAQYTDINFTQLLNSPLFSSGGLDLGATNVKMEKEEDI